MRSRFFLVLLVAAGCGGGGSSGRTSPCDAGQAFCGGSCIDPSVSHDHCGASGLCQAGSAGVACRADQVCSAGECACPGGRVACGGSCIDPQTSLQFCGATSCSTGAVGQTCAAGQVCDQGACSTLQDLDWRPALRLTRAPRFVEDPDTVLAHITFDETTMEMVDSTENTHWTLVGNPGASLNTFWSPGQWYAGPFSAGAYWVATTVGSTNPTKDFLDTRTNGTFTVCARIKPGKHPYFTPNKIIISNGIPEGDVVGAGGWSLMQMHDAYCFHYRDTYYRPPPAPDQSPAWGEWMAPMTWTIDAESLASMEWSWICGGRDGTALTLLREYLVNGTTFPMGNQAAGPVGAFQSSAFLPSIGAYADGSGPLWDGGVYEIIVTSDRPTEGNMANIIANASGGLVYGNEAPIPMPGADGAVHLASAATVRVEPTGDVIADSHLVVGGKVSRNPNVAGECLGFTATASAWTSAALGSYITPLRIVQANGVRTEVTFIDPAADHCLNVGLAAGGNRYVCGTPPALGPGTTHTFRYCFDADDGLLRFYADDAITPFATSTDVFTTADFPRLDLASTVTSLELASANLRIRRVFACPAADPAACR